MRFNVSAIRTGMIDRILWSPDRIECLMLALLIGCHKLNKITGCRFVMSCSILRSLNPFQVKFRIRIIGMRINCIPLRINSFTLCFTSPAEEDISFTLWNAVSRDQCINLNIFIDLKLIICVKQTCLSRIS